jgi:gamma-glutamyltranspeptidase/glutathione hydrolase
MVVAPHHLAAQSGLAVLREGGNAIEAMVAAAASIAVVYPHMNSIGGDGFWLIQEPGKPPVGIDASGAAAGLATRAFYTDQGHAAIPARGPLAALTVPGTVSGWAKALELAAQSGGRMPLTRLLADAIAYAEDGVPLTPAHIGMIETKGEELAGVAGFARLFAPPEPHDSGALLLQPRLAGTLRRLAAVGLGDFYGGDVARSMAADLEAAGSPLRLGDFEAHRANLVTPLRTKLSVGTVYNLPPPTQGLASLLILAIYDKIRAARADGFEHVHRLVEATKRAFIIRDAVITCPSRVPASPAGFLRDKVIIEEAEAIVLNKAAPWPAVTPANGDTVWMGAIDGEGRAVSFIQSIYWEFGSGLLLPDTGVLMANRGLNFSLDPGALNRLEPGCKPFHTLNPALATLSDGRVMVYGAMGGDGQPQSQAAVFTRYAFHNQPLAAAIAAPRWLLGRTWGASSTSLKLENRFPARVIKALWRAGHELEMLDDFTDMMGHAGAVVRHPSGLYEGAADPRSDGASTADRGASGKTPVNDPAMRPPAASVARAPASSRRASRTRRPRCTPSRFR